MTTAQNPVSVLDAYEYPQSVVTLSGDTVNEGDLLYWDTVNYAARPVTASSQIQTNFLGVAVGSNNPAVYGGDTALAAVPVLARACVFFYTTASDTYNHFDDVTVGADAQTITKVGVTTNNRVGFIILDPPATARALQSTPVPETLAGAAGVRVRVLLEPKHKVGATL